MESVFKNARKVTIRYNMPLDTVVHDVLPHEIKEIREKVHTVHTKMTFDWWVNFSVIITGFGTMLLAVIELLKFLKE